MSRNRSMWFVGVWFLTFELWIDISLKGLKASMKKRKSNYKNKGNNTQIEHADRKEITITIFVFFLLQFACECVCLQYMSELHWLPSYSLHFIHIKNSCNTHLKYTRLSWGGASALRDCMKMTGLVRKAIKISYIIIFATTCFTTKNQQKKYKLKNFRWCTPLWTFKLSQ